MGEPDITLPQNISNQIWSSAQQDGTLYVPSSSEKKRSVMMYFLLGIMVVLAEKKVNSFEYFHLRQAMGWWMVFLLSLVASVVILFIPWIRGLSILLMIGMVIFFCIFLKQAWDGKIKSETDKYLLAVFPSLGNWLIHLFDLHIDPNEFKPLENPPIQQ